MIADNYGGTQAQKLFEAVLESNNYDGQAVYQALQNKDFRNRIQTIFDDTNSIITRVMDDPENISKDDVRVMRHNHQVLSMRMIYLKVNRCKNVTLTIPGLCQQQKQLKLNCCKYITLMSLLQ